MCIRHDATKDRAAFVPGRGVAGFEQHQEHVTVRFSDGAEEDAAGWSWSGTPPTARRRTAGWAPRVAWSARILRLGFPRSRLGIGALRVMGAAGSFLRLPELAARFATEDRGGAWPLPAYPPSGVPAA